MKSRASHDAPKDVQIELSIRLSNGHFETSIAVPMGAPSDIAMSAVQSWLGMAEALLKLHQVQRVNVEVP